MSKQNETSIVRDLIRSTSRNVRKLRSEAKVSLELKDDLLEEAEISKQSLLQEISLAQASILKTVFDNFEKNPFIHRDELTKIIAANLSIIDPKYMDSFFEVAEEMFSHIKAYKENLELQIGSTSNQEVANKIYLSRTTDLNVKNSRFSEGKITRLKKSTKKVEFTSLGVILYITDPDALLLIYPKSNIGGYFTTISPTLGDGRTIPIPLMVINGENKRYATHEKSHSENKYIKDALIGRKNKESHSKAKTNVNNDKQFNKYDPIEEIWGTSTDVTKARESARNIIVQSMYSNPIQEIRKTDTYNDVIAYSLQCAKNELIAEFKGNTGDPIGHMKLLKNVYGSYNFFSKDLIINSDPRLLNYLTQDYHEKLDEYTKPVLDIFYSYRVRVFKSQWKDRLEIFNYVLATTPIDRWPEQMDRLGYEKEISIVNSCIKKLDIFEDEMLIFTQINQGDALKSRYFDDYINNEIIPLKLKLELLLETGTGQSCLTAFYNIEKEIDKAIKVFEERSEYELIFLTNEITLDSRDVGFLIRSLKSKIPKNSLFFQEIKDNYNELTIDNELPYEYYSNISILIVILTKKVLKLEKIRYDLKKIFDIYNNISKLHSSFTIELEQPDNPMKVQPIPGWMSKEWFEKSLKFSKLLNNQQKLAQTIDAFYKPLEKYEYSLSELIEKIKKDKQEFRSLEYKDRPTGPA